MAYRALINVSLGLTPSAKPGEEIPATYVDHLGAEFKVDFKRLVELGAAEEISAPAKKPAAKSTK